MLFQIRPLLELSKGALFPTSTPCEGGLKLLFHGVLDFSSKPLSSPRPLELGDRRETKLCFFVCEEHNAKIVFLHDQVYRKSIKNQSQINAKSMPIKFCKFDINGCPTGPQKPSKINEKRDRNFDGIPID